MSARRHDALRLAFALGCTVVLMVFKVHAAAWATPLLSLESRADFKIASFPTPVLAMVLGNGELGQPSAESYALVLGTQQNWSVATPRWRWRAVHVPPVARTPAVHAIDGEGHGHHTRWIGLIDRRVLADLMVVLQL